MNAVVSGQAGVALLLEGEELSSLHVGRPAEVIRRQPREVPFLLGEAKDLQFLSDVDVQEVGRRLEQASDQVDALHLALILLDGSLSADTRRTAAEELEELLATGENLQFVERILYAHPLPSGADLAGARSACTELSHKTLALLKRLVELQPTIEEIHIAWDQVADELFKGGRDRASVRSIMVREGHFSELVTLRSKERPLDGLAMIILSMQSFRAIPNHGQILQAWLAPLRSSRPRRVGPRSEGPDGVEDFEHEDQTSQRGGAYIPARMQSAILWSAVGAGLVGIPGAFGAHADVPVLLGIWTTLLIRLAALAGDSLSKGTAAKIATSVLVGIGGFQAGVKLATTYFAYTGIGTIPAVVNAGSNATLTYIFGLSAARVFLSMSPQDSVAKIIKGIVDRITGKPPDGGTEG